MAQPIHCDICNVNEPAQFLMTDLGNGSTLGLCPSCAGPFFRMVSDQLLGHTEATEGEPVPDAAPEPELAPTGPTEAHKTERWPHTEHVIPPGMRRRNEKREAEREEHLLAADATEDEPSSEG